MSQCSLGNQERYKRNADPIEALKSAQSFRQLYKFSSISSTKRARSHGNGGLSGQKLYERGWPGTLTVPWSGSDLTKASNSATEVPGIVFKVHSRGVSEAELEALVAVAVFDPAFTPTVLDWLDELEATRGLWMTRVIAAAAMPPTLSAPTR